MGHSPEHQLPHSSCHALQCACGLCQLQLFQAVPWHGSQDAWAWNWSQQAARTEQSRYREFGCMAMCWAIPAALLGAWSVLSTSRSPLYWSSYELYMLEWGVCISSTFLVTQSQFPWKPLYWKSKPLPSSKFMCFPRYFKRVVFLSQHWFGLKEIGNNVTYLCAAFKGEAKFHSCLCVCTAWVFGYVGKKEWIQHDLSASSRKNLQVCCFPCRVKRKHCFASTGFAEESLGVERPSKLQAGCYKEPLAIPTLQKPVCVSPLTALLMEALFSLLWFSRSVISPTSALGEVLPISQLRKLKCWYYMTCPNNAISCQAEIEIRGFENWFITLMIWWDSHSQTLATGQASGKAKHTEN